MRQTEIYFFFQNLALYILLGLGAIIIFCIFVVWIIEKIKRVVTKLRKYRGDGMTEIELTLNSPITEEQLDAIVDVDFDHTNRIWFNTKHGKQVEFVKVKPVTSNADRIRSMSDEQLALAIRMTANCDLCPIKNCKARHYSSPDSCERHWLQWLRSPVGGDGE